jgi:ABC-type molybdate transport system substrate-binding protein
VAILPLSLASAPAMQAGGRFWEIPRAAYPLLEVTSVLLRDSPNRNVARAFLIYINSKTGREVMQMYGFLTPR